MQDKMATGENQQQQFLAGPQTPALWSSSLSSRRFAIISLFAFVVIVHVTLDQAKYKNSTIPGRTVQVVVSKARSKPEVIESNHLNSSSMTSQQAAFAILSLKNSDAVSSSKALQSRLHALILNDDKNDGNDKAIRDIPKPPHTPGAFLHVGKTGGSTLSSQLRNGCHSWVKKPCRIPLNESRLSLLTTYYHTPDFHLLPKQRYDFYVWVLRDPFSRLLSAFTYQHPANMDYSKSDKNWARYVHQSMQVFACFPTLESFATAIGDDPDDFDYPFDVKTVNNTDCTRLARALMQNKVLTEPSHFYHDTKLIESLLPASAWNATILAIRTEHMWDDWTTANKWLGQRNFVATFPSIRARQQNETNIPVTKDISRMGRKRLCRALKDEYKVYFDLIVRAVNLDEQGRQEMFDLARRNCPEE